MRVRSNTIVRRFDGGEVTIHTDNPDQKEIRVPVYALVEDR